MSPNAWAVVGTVTSNGYGRGIPGCTITKNVEVMQGMIQADMVQDLAPEDILLDYCEQLTSVLVPEEAFQPSQFSQSKSIFLDHHEDLIETTPPSNSALDAGSKNMALDVRRFLNQYANARRQRASGTSPVSSSSLVTPAQPSTSATAAASVEPSDAPSTNSTPVAPIFQDSTSTTAATGSGPT
ncbi:MAG: hypothetical protein J3Q66DRAFT_363830 [Benniella sp.]|nr:MAG: hypothetical protein J3Q66DRAFT_363830 [Benniella sp.]